MIVRLPMLGQKMDVTNRVLNVKYPDGCYENIIISV